MLVQYGRDLLVTCQNAAKLSEDLVSEWLKSYMFRGQALGEAKGNAIARWLSDHSAFKTHARPISRDELLARGLTIRSLEQDQVEQDLFLSVHHATAHTFNNAPAAMKIIENNLGKAYVRTMNVLQIVQAPIPLPVQPPTAPPPVAAPPVSFRKKLAQRLFGLRWPRRR